jgi:hypothetical protein
MHGFCSTDLLLCCKDTVHDSSWDFQSRHGEFQQRRYLGLHNNSLFSVKHIPLVTRGGIERAVQRIFERRVGNKAISMHFQAAGLSRLPASTANKGLTANKFKPLLTKEKDNKNKTMKFVLKKCLRLSYTINKSMVSISYYKNRVR